MADEETQVVEDQEAPGGQTETPGADQTGEEPEKRTTEDVTERVRRANAEAAKYRVERNEARQELEQLQAQVKKMQAEAQKAFQEQIDGMKKKLEEQEAAAKAAELGRLRIEAAANAGLPPDAADRLKGETAEELKADAEELAKLMPVRKGTRIGNSGSPGQVSRAEQIHRRIGGRQADVFSPEFQRNKGGGVVNEGGS